jgi:hypothetical protein
VELSLGGNRIGTLDELKPITGLRIQSLDLLAGGMRILFGHCPGTAVSIS